MDALGELNTIVGALVLVVGAVSGMLLGTLKTVRDSNSDLRGRVGDLEQANAALVAKNTTLQADVAALQRSVRGDDVLETITTKLDEHHREAKVHWARDEALLTSVADHLANGEHR